MITVSNTVMQALLIAVVVLPLLGSAAALLPPPPGLQGRSPQQAVLRHGVTVTGAVLAAAVVLALGFDTERPGTVQAESDVEWIPALGTHLHLGVDGVSLPLLVLTALLTFLCALYSYGAGTRTPAAGDIHEEDAARTDSTDRTDSLAGTADGNGNVDGADAPDAPRTGSPQSFVALLLLLEAGMLATFATLDLLLFFLAFETVLVPMYFLIARWGGGAQRTAAAWKFILYTLLGSVVMLLGLLLVGIRSGTFDMVALATDSHPALTGTTQLVAALAIGIGLAVKTPMWPLHSWLPDAHTAAPTVGSVLLAGVLLKMGTYGFVRILLPVAPDGLHTLAPYLAVLAATGIVYGSLACLALARRGAGGDLKRLIAYSSVGHMGFVLLGIATMTPTGVNGALFANIAHGLITGLLFFLVGALKERTGSTDLDTLSGGTGGALYGTAPRLGGLLAFGAVASLGLPGLAGFWGEMLALFGAYEPAAGLNRPAFLACMSLGGLGTLLTAAYLLVVVRRVCMGEPHAAPGAVERPQLHDPEPESEQKRESGQEPGGETEPDGETAPEEETEPEEVAETDAETEPETEPEGDAEADGETEPDAATEPEPSDADSAEPEPAKPESAEPESARPAPAEPTPTPEPATAPAPAPAPAPVLTPVRLPDIRAYEYASWTPLVVLTVATGLWPALLLGLSDPAVQSLLPGVNR